METVLLEKKDILDTSKSWKSILYNDNDSKSINIFKQKRIKEYISNCYTEKTLAKDMDLATLLILLKHRNCFIRLPEYENIKAKKDVNTVTKVGNVSMGKIISLKSNQYTFNFSITILDEKYTEEKLEKTFDYAPRTYTLTDHTGQLGKNWKTQKRDKFVFLKKTDKIYVEVFYG